MDNTGSATTAGFRCDPPRLSDSSRAASGRPKRPPPLASPASRAANPLWVAPDVRGPLFAAPPTPFLVAPPSTSLYRNSR